MIRIQNHMITREHPEHSFARDGPSVLRDLIVLGRVRIEIELAIKLRRICNSAIKSTASLNSCSHQRLVQHRKCSRFTHTYMAYARIRSLLRPASSRACTEAFGGTVHLAMALHSDADLYSIRCLWAIGMHTSGPQAPPTHSGIAPGFPYEARSRDKCSQRWWMHLIVLVGESCGFINTYPLAGRDSFKTNHKMIHGHIINDESDCIQCEDKKPLDQISTVPVAECHYTTAYVVKIILLKGHFTVTVISTNFQLLTSEMMHNKHGKRISLIATITDCVALIVPRNKFTNVPA